MNMKPKYIIAFTDAECQDGIEKILAKDSCN